MAQKVVVRLVPKSRSQAPRMDFGISAVAPVAREFQPDPRRARTALSWLSSAKPLAVKPTEAHRIEANLTPGEVKEMFAVALNQGAYSTRREGRITQQEAFDVPETELKIPDELKDTIDFAYIPRPVEFYAPSYIPPAQGTVHVRLADVEAALNVPRAHRSGWTGAGVKVAMVDSGFFPHPYFAANGYKLLPVASPGVINAEEDLSGHGTGECANIFTVAPDCTVYGVKSGPSAATSLETAIGLVPHILSCSWGWDVDHQTRSELQSNDPNFFNEMLDIETILADAVNSGIVVVFSAGNGHRAFPACMPNVIAAGGVTVMPDGSLEASSYASSFTSKLYPQRQIPDFCAVVGSFANGAVMPNHIMLPVPPKSELDGLNFKPAQNGLGWGIFSGTSAACPQIAGAVALLRGIRRGASLDQVRTALVKTATDVAHGKTALGDAAKTGPDAATGAGFVNVRSACEFISAVS